VECKKQDAPAREIEDDQKKIRAFMEDTRYEYAFRLQVIYGRDGLRGELFFRNGKRINSMKLLMPSQQSCQKQRRTSTPDNSLGDNHGQNALSGPLFYGA
jgi:hypothetical protein